MDKGQPQGPTCASQLRYIEYFDKALREDVPNRVIRILRLNMLTVPLAEKTGTYRPYLRISCSGREVYLGYPSKGASFTAGSSEKVELDLSDHEIIVKEDFKVEMFNGVPKKYADEQRLADKATFFMCLHTGFLQEPSDEEHTMVFSKKVATDHFAVLPFPPLFLSVCLCAELSRLCRGPRKKGRFQLDSRTLEPGH